jgi:hypothetical protein
MGEFISQTDHKIDYQCKLVKDEGVKPKLLSILNNSPIIERDSSE